mgnify:CR=1 FL=1
MFDCADATAALDGTDPRVTEESVWCVPGTDHSGTVLLVGVVHDHPASVTRAARLVEALDPDILALELPPLAVSLFELYAHDDHTPPRLGGEMSAALQAASDARAVGIDAPNPRYLRRLARQLLADRPPRAVTVSVLRDLVAVSAHALACRRGALLGTSTPLRPRIYEHLQHDSSLLDSPDVQAADERAHLAQHRAFLGAIELPPKTLLVDGLREETMAARLDALRREGDVVAVVGMEHAPPLSARLTGDPPQ